MKTENHPKLTTSQRQAVGYGVLGLILIVLGVKLFIQQTHQSEVSINFNGKPTLLFFTMSEPCICIRDIIGRANTQIVLWPDEKHHPVQLLRLEFGEHRELEKRYRVYHAPALILLDEHEEVIWSQLYPLEGSKPLNLEELEQIIAEKWK